MKLNCRLWPPDSVRPFHTIGDTESGSGVLPKGATNDNPVGRVSVTRTVSESSPSLVSVMVYAVVPPRYVLLGSATLLADTFGAPRTLIGAVSSVAGMEIFNALAATRL